MLRKGGFKTALLVVCAVAVCTSCARLRPAPPERPVPPTPVVPTVPTAPVGPVVSELEYKSVEEIRSRLGYIGSGSVEMSLRPREKLGAEPIYFSRRPLYGMIELGDSEDKRFVLVIDESKGTRSGYDTLYIDANNNEDLADDTKIAANIRGDGSMTEFPTATVTVECGGREYPYRITPMVYSYGDTRVRWSAAGYCEGELRFGDKTYKVALFDDTCNGVFNDAFAVPRGYPTSGSVYARGDTMVIDIDGDGEFKKSYNDTPEMYHVGKYISFGDTCYELEIAPSGRTITVSEAEDPCGYIASEQEGYSVELIGDDGALKLNGGASRVKAPAGEYRFAACSFESKDDRGTPWRIIGRGSWQQPVITVNPDESASLEFGPPLTASLTVAKGGGAFQFGLEIKGQGGETYSAGDFERAKSRVQPPRLEIRDEKGEIVARGKFEFG